ncbi:hypothetical protein JK386_00885 [Nocardioides sp. zg-536]|uniref:Uncharacterized protein n=1 Tax=Nocardioides faecalis TaxID=2803858 RepID=A0A938Y3G6_9ACTN|nr:hypothetical protein [Nocardioides faecalis]MBM9458452.1 hypothetical protein [Nocardioides faecalis]QVI58467.1 hypothetical protein KG111_15975 [Nocardioides faecalis]
MEALELIVDEGRPASAGRFFSLGVDLLDLLDELSDDVTVSWQVRDLRVGSALATIAPPEDKPHTGGVLRLLVSSLGVVGDSGPLPDGWTPDAVKVAHRFVDHGQAAENEADWVPPRLRLLTDGAQAGDDVSLTPALVERLATLQPFERKMPGSVRGILVGLNVSRGNRASLKVPSGRVVRVGFDIGMREALKEALYSAVELRGEVRQDGDGQIFHIRADDIEPLAEPRIGWAEMFGTAPNYTGGVPVDEWLEANRGEA